jgi:antitoxin component YwqK of YwqJK toxin-antitoxin module
MRHQEFYSTGELKGEGEMLQIRDCTSRGDGRQVDFDDHECCIECLLDITLRKIKTWNYYHKNGSLITTGSYVVLDYMGVPSVRDGVWSVFQENGKLFQQVVYSEGKITELSMFDSEGARIE